jgi:single-strand DNA-binding protein
MLNRINVMGRLTKTPELRHTQGGTAVASFTIAVDRDRKNESGERETDFIPVVVWGKGGEFVASNFSKGQLAAIDGRIQIRDWTDKDGNKRTTAEIVANNVYFCGSKKEENTDMGFGSLPKNQFADVTEDDGELPW